MRENLLFLTHRIPYPPNKGDKIRSFHLLDHLRKAYRVHLGTFVDDEEDWRYSEEVEKMCGECCILPLPSRYRSLAGLLTGEALTLPHYRSTQLQKWVDNLIARFGIGKIVVFSSAMAQYVEHHCNVLRIMDFVDIDSDKWTQYSNSRPWPLSFIYAREGRLLEQYERKIASLFAASFFVSPQEADHFKTIAPECASRIGFYQNGVDSDYFSPDRTYPNPYSSGEEAIVFTGAMDYWPNVEAVTWFSRKIFPLVRKEQSAARFHIVGSNPAPEVRRLSVLENVIVTGRVEDVRPYLAHARLAVAPLKIARGVQNKVLEAMAMAIPVVATPQALEGIVENEGCLAGKDEAEFSKHIVSLLENPVEISGRSCILENYDWGSNLRIISSCLGEES